MRLRDMIIQETAAVTAAVVAMTGSTMLKRCGSVRRGLQQHRSAKGSRTKAPAGKADAHTVIEQTLRVLQQK